MPPLFAIVIERDPLQWADLPAGLVQWLQAAGIFATLGLLVGFPLGLALRLPGLRREDRAALPGWMITLFALCTVVAVLGYLIGGVLAASREPDRPPSIVQTVALAGGGAAALLAVGLPFLLNLTRLRFRRIYALAKLSFKEALRRRVLYAFSFMLLVFLFASWFVPSMPKDQVRTYVDVVYTAISLLLLVPAVVLASFSIPADIKQQTIHTVVTKPVERFEIVLGRFLGYLALMSLVLVVMTAVSLLYVLRGIHPEAAAESLKAREPLYGELKFEGTGDEKKAINVGREWDYRSYISRPNPGETPHVARWDFAHVPGYLGDRPEVLSEYSFDVFRTTKGEEGRDVSCTFRFYTWRYRAKNDEKFLAERKERAGTAGRNSQVDNELAEKYGYFELAGQPVTDYRTLSLLLPGGLFRNARAADPEREQELKARNEARPPDLQVRVLCESPTQYVGMARYDYYLRLDAGGRSEAVLFALNFFKGAFGIWLQLALMIGLAVVLSTYLNGVISMLVTLLLFIGGWCREFIESVARGTNPGGGPLESFKKLANRELVGASVQDSASIGDQLISGSDATSRAVMRLLIDLVPDISRFDLTTYVADGFNISGVQLGMGFLLLVGYLLPWAVLAYYLLRWREIAGAT